MRAQALAALVLGLCATPALAISGGRSADIARTPFVAKVGGCTGTLIAPDRVLTAAHCVDGAFPDATRVYVGVDPVRDRKAPPIPVRGFAIHPGYKVSFPFSSRSPINAIATDDVALVLLAVPVAGVTPVRVAGRGDAALERAGRAAQLLGYGEILTPSSTRPVGSVRLHEGAVELLGRGACARSYPKAVTRRMICDADANERKPYTQSCGGDSGGPLIARGPRGPVQIGITSWGGEVKEAGCGERNLPSVSMRISAYNDFITQREPTIAPFPTGPATITGEPRAGETLTCAAALGGSPARLAYRWVTTRFSGQLRDDNARGLITAIPGRTRSTLQVSRELVGRKVACEIRATNRGGHVRVFTRNLVLG